jgi:hypothetical protein
MKKVSLTLGGVPLRDLMQYAFSDAHRKEIDRHEDAKSSYQKFVSSTKKGYNDEESKTE